MRYARDSGDALGFFRTYLNRTLRGSVVDMTQTEDSLIKPSRPSLFQSISISSMSINDDPTDSEFIELVIRPQSGWIKIDWKELVAYRELLWFLVWRDILLRYKQTVLGGAWAILQPLIMMLTFSFIFGRIANLPSDGFPYPVFVFAGLIPWTLFSQGFAQSALSLVSNNQLLTKVYFPRVIVPTAAAAVFLVDVIISLGVYAVILAYYHILPSWTIVFFPLLVILTLFATLSFGLTLSALTVFYRDFRHIVPFMTQILMFVSPVFYSTSMIKRPMYRWIMSLNPMFGIISAYRSAILGLDWDFTCLAISSVVAVGGFFFGMFYFRRTERRLSDFA
jgi:lipopolysaccharide transport system permease protein